MAGFVEMNHVYKRYQMGEVTITALSDVNFSIQQGEFVVIVGPSGAGKTTVLNILGGMDQCDEGEILVDGAKINEYRPKQLIGYRRYDIGFVFQFYNLIPNLTAKENVELASQICKNPLDAKEVLTQVGLALAKSPKLLLCDEPTGALDYNTGKNILKLLQDTCRQDGMTVIVITHNSALAPMADRVIQFKNGRVDKVELNPHPTLVEDIEW